MNEAGLRFAGDPGLREIDRAVPFTAREQRDLRFPLFPAPPSRGGEHGRYPSALSTATITGMDASESTVVMNVPCAMVRVLPPYW